MPCAAAVRAPAQLVSCWAASRVMEFVESGPDLVDEPVDGPLMEVSTDMAVPFGMTADAVDTGGQGAVVGRLRRAESWRRRSAISFSNSMMRCAPAMVMPSPIRPARAAMWFSSVRL